MTDLLTGRIPIRRSCGHTQAADLSKVKPFDRKKLIEKFRAESCFACKDDPDSRRRRSAFLAERRAGEARETAELEERFRLDPMQGPDSIRPWGARIRAVMVAAAWDELGLDEADFAAQVAEVAAAIDSAGWWLDHRETQVADLPATLAAAFADVDAGTENPF